MLQDFKSVSKHFATLKIKGSSVHMWLDQDKVKNVI